MIIINVTRDEKTRHNITTNGQHSSSDKRLVALKILALF